MPLVNGVEVSQEELVQMCAVDTGLFGQVFFPKTIRQESPAFHQAMDHLIDDPRYPLVSIEVFRGGAKTTRLRLHTAKRIAYKISKTILYVGKSQPHAARSLWWLRKQIERNTFFAQTFGLRPGAKWNDEEMQIYHGVEDDTIWVIGMGVTGSTRGINFDDFRPDLIICDDLVDEENANTQESRQKIYKLVHGSLKNSLAPRSENPYSKMAILQTPLDVEDISQKAKTNPEFKCMRCGCWTPETEDLPIDQRESAWPARWSSEELRAKYKAALANNELSLFAAEWECRLITPETSVFRQEWIRYFGEGEAEPEPALHEMTVVMVVDPVPPPSEREVEKNLHGKDYEALVVVGKCRGKLYVLESSANRGHDPSWTVQEFFRLASKWRPRRIKIESVAYQRTLVWLLRQAMMKVGRYWAIIEYNDRRSKYNRIVDGLKGVLSEGQLYVRREQSELIRQITYYSNVKHDDELEATAIAAEDLQFELDAEAGGYDDDDSPALVYRRGAP